MSLFGLMDVRRLLFVLALVAPLGLLNCGGPPPNSTYGAYSVGEMASVSYGTIVSMRPVAIQTPPTGIGALTGAAAGGVAGSYIGGDPRANILGAIGGALLGGIAGSAVEGSLSGGRAIEFIIRLDDGRTVSVVQSNENRFAIGQRVAVIYGRRVRLAPVYG